MGVHRSEILRGGYIFIPAPPRVRYGGGLCFTAMFHVLSHNVHYAFTGRNKNNDLAVEQYIIAVMSCLRQVC